MLSVAVRAAEARHARQATFKRTSHEASRFAQSVLQSSRRQVEEALGTRLCIEIEVSVHAFLVDRDRCARQHSVLALVDFLSTDDRRGNGENCENRPICKLTGHHFSIDSLINSL